MPFLRLLLGVCLLSVSILPPALAQVVRLTGLVQARSTGQPLPFVNIGIRGKSTGTVADAHGNFGLQISEALASDTLTFSAIGYQEQGLPIAQLATGQKLLIQLTEKAAALPEVVVRGRPAKVRRLGTTSHNPLLWGNVSNRETHDIREFSKLISLDDKPSQLVSAHIFLRYPTVDTITFRLNFYGVSQGLPGSRLVEQTILVRAAIHNGWLTIDLTRYALAFQADFYLGFEFLPDDQPRTALAFSYGAQFGGAAVVRESSLGYWKREPGASLAAYVTVKQ